MKTHPLIVFGLIVTFLALTFAIDTTTKDISSDLGHHRSRRASLHELLQKNGQIGSVPPKSFVKNENRRVLVIGDGDEPSNSVTEDKEPSQTTKDKERTDFYKSDKEVSTGFFDSLSSYARHHSNMDAPSYADPNLLAAVMSQADKANFKYPINGKPSHPSPQEDQMISASAHYNEYGNNGNEINPYEMLPPSFHELLDIPIHTYSNGSSFNPLDKFKKNSRNPIISGGYASTNVNGQSNNIEDDERLTDVAPSYVTRRPFLKSVSNSNKKLEYANLIRNSYKEKDSESHTIPSTTIRSRPKRPSLRFRTRSPSYTKSTTERSPLRPDISRVPSVPSRKTNNNNYRLNKRPVNEDIGDAFESLKYDVVKHSYGSEQQENDLYKASPEEKPISPVRPNKNRGTNYNNSWKNNLHTRENENNENVIKTPIYSRPHVYKEEVKRKDFTKNYTRRKTTSSPDFKPSKIDPYANKTPPKNPYFREVTVKQYIRPTTYRPIYRTSPAKKNVIQPTTYKPKTNINVLPPVVNTYERPSRNNQVYYENNNNAIPAHNFHRSDDSHTEVSFQHNENNLGNDFIQPTFHSQNFERPEIHNPSPYRPPSSHGFNINSFNPWRNGNEFNDHQRRIPQRRFKPRRPQPKKSIWPSFFERFNIFRSRSVNRRSGNAGPISVNRVNKKLNSKNKKDSMYVLSNEAAPKHARKMVVLGPFNKPPIGAPPFYPPPEYKSKEPKYLQSRSNARMGKVRKQRGPSFKVVNLPTESRNISGDNKVNSKYGSVNDISKPNPQNFKRLLSRKAVKNANGKTKSSSTKNQRKTFVGPLKTPVMITHDNVHLFQEVKDEDKEKLIAAKFEIPRRQTVRRSGVDRNVIPIPVPLATPGSKSNFILTHLPNPQFGNILSKRSGNVVPSKKINKRSENIAQSPTKRGGIGQVISPRYLNLNQPQSYMEPTISDVSYGGWQTVGKSDLKHSLDSTVKQNLDSSVLNRQNSS